MVFGPLQILTTIVCTNLTMLILQKADLFDVRFGFKINAVKKLFEEEYRAYEDNMALIDYVAYEQIQEMLRLIEQDTRAIYNTLEELDPTINSVQPSLVKISRMFNAHIDFDVEWAKFIGQQYILEIKDEKSVFCKARQKIAN